MQAAYRNSGRTRAGVSFVVSLMFGLWLQVIALTVSPGFHEWLHEDSHSASHECPVTLLNKGSIVPGTSGVTVSVPFSPACVIVSLESISLPSEEYRLSHSRAPPSC